MNFRSPEEESQQTDGVVAVAPTIVDQVRAVMDRDDVTQSKVAKEAKVTTGLLSAWLAGKYSGDNRAVNEKMTKWLRTRGERVAMESLIAQTPRFFESETAMELLSHLNYAQSSADMLLVVGAPGLGKTTTINEHARQFSSVWIATFSQATTTVIPCLQVIGQSMGIIAKGTGGMRIENEIVDKMRNTGGLLILDEAHHLSSKALDAVRSLFDKSDIGIALIGAPELAAKVDRMPQVHSRIGLRISLMKPLEGDVDAMLDAWNIVQKGERNLIRQVAMKSGAIRSASRTLRLASALASGAGEKRSLKHIEQAIAIRTARQAGEE